MSDRFITAAEFAYNEIYRRIICGDIPPGERVNQDAEAKRLQLSRMPVREALGRLASEGLVIIQAHRGAVVRPLSLEDLDDLYQLRIELEGLAGRLGTPNLTDDELQQMRSFIPDMERVVAAEDMEGWLEVDWSFHRILYETVERPRLMQLIKRYREEAKRYRLLGLSLPDELALSLHDHYRILSALDDRDAVRVEQLIQGTIEESQTKVVQKLTRNSAIPDENESTEDQQDSVPLSS